VSAAVCGQVVPQNRIARHRRDVPVCRIAILDDFQDAWTHTDGVRRMRERVEVTIFTERFGGPAALRGFDVLIANRERTRFDRALLEALDGVRLIIQTGKHNPHIDFEAAADCDLFIAVAAVADYKPKSATTAKIKKEVAGADLTLELTRTPDILAEVKGNFLKIGFAAESENLVENARDELVKKKLDLVAANDITASDSGFEVDTNRVTIIDKNGKTEELPLMSKKEVADKLLDRVVRLFKKA